MSIDTAGLPTAYQKATFRPCLFSPSGRFRSFVDATTAYAAAITEGDATGRYARATALAVRRYARESGKNETVCLFEVIGYATAVYHLTERQPS
jgi:precorrin-6x reductase